MEKAVSKIALHPSVPTRTLSRLTGFKPVSISVGLNETVLCLLVRDEVAEGIFARTAQTGFASFPKTQTEEKYSSIVEVSGPAGSHEIRLSGLTATFPAVEMLPGNEVLVVATRCQRLPDGSNELNAKVYDLLGTLQREFLLGDGINHVQVDISGNIWVGYFDEGVYGNFGWQNDPFGAAGLSCFTGIGRKLWDFHPPEGFDPISDCYALNASRSGVWAYYYTDFPFAHIDSNWQVRCWKTKSAGGHTFAVGGQKVLLYGGYNEERTTCKLFKLGENNTELIAHVSLVFPMEVDLSRSTVIGRDAELHVFSGDDWYRFSIESLG
jgi:hypothetical protein